jgi:hypothetical protein|tara:strand:- start:648 stop:821 length:174 start_codon:yes stop_codon:yes gene_type:complete
MKTATIFHANETLTAEELVVAGHIQLIITVSEDGEEIEQKLVDTVAEADAYVAALNE